MAIKLSANLNFLFTEIGGKISDRIRLASNHSFRAVEIPYPQEELLDVIQAIKDTGITVSLMNIAIDKTKEKLKYGSASIPGEEIEFKMQLDKTVEFAKSINCKKIHLMAGTIQTKLECEHLRTYIANLKTASKVLQLNNMIGVIEPINKYAIQSYFMDSYVKAMAVLNEVGYDNIKVMVDIYHLQHICGNFTKTLEEYGHVIGHFQIAQVPNRNEPDTPGELNYGYIFETLKKFGYDGWIGCEYKPKTTTVQGLNWISKFNICL